jgi:proteasome assembly chaperone (PAC2) family protein
MDGLRISKHPDLDRAVLVGAFAGWNDAATAASWAVKFLVNQWDATQFADVDPDEFYDFTETRPRVRVSSGSLRQFTWPATRFYYHQAPRENDEPAGRDVVLLLGEEPQLRWQAFSRTVMDLCRRFNVADIVLMGALVAEVPHTVPVQVSGVSNHAPWLRQMAENGIERVTYDGPTGILSALQEAGRKDGLKATSLWAVAPYYVSATPNLPVAEALLRKLDGLYGFGLRLQDLSRAAKRFNQRVSSLVAEDSDVSAYVRELERRAGGEGSLDAPAERPSLPSISPYTAAEQDLPSAEEAIQDVEAWLRRFREGSGAD